MAPIAFDSATTTENNLNGKGPMGTPTDPQRITFSNVGTTTPTSGVAMDLRIESDSEYDACK